VARGTELAGCILIDADYRVEEEAAAVEESDSITLTPEETRKYDSPTDTHRSPDPDHRENLDLFPADILKLPEFADD